MEQPDIMNLLKDKSGLVKYLYDMITSSEKNAIGLRQMKERGWSQEGMLDKVVEVTAIQSSQMKHLALVCLLMVQSREFDSMVAHLMIDMGRGQEALQEMLKAKFRNKY